VTVKKIVLYNDKLRKRMEELLRSVLFLEP